MLHLGNLERLKSRRHRFGRVAACKSSRTAELLSKAFRDVFACSTIFIPFFRYFIFITVRSFLCFCPLCFSFLLCLTYSHKSDRFHLVHETICKTVAAHVSRCM